MFGPVRVSTGAEIGRIELDFEGFGVVAENIEDGQELVGLFRFLAFVFVVERVSFLLFRFDLVEAVCISYIL